MSKILLSKSGGEVADELQRGVAQGSTIRVINYHNTPASRADEYERQLTMAAERFSACTELDVLALFDSGTWHKDAPGVIPVFYEGYVNNFEVALPMVERLGLTAWFFIPSAFLSVPVPQQREFAATHKIGLVNEGGERVALSWDEVREIEARGHVIASHTRHHTGISLDTPDDVLSEEILGSQREFEEQLGHPVRTFAWLYGSEYGSDARADRYVRQAGYELLFSNFRLQRLSHPNVS